MGYSIFAIYTFKLSVHLSKYRACRIACDVLLEFTSPVLPELVLSSHPSGVKLIAINDATSELVIGRDQSAGLVFDFRGVSKRHCRITRQRAGWLIEDLNSTNGILLHRHRSEVMHLRSQSSKLEDGDLIQLGDSKIIVNLLAAKLDQTEIIEPDLPPAATEMFSYIEHANPPSNIAENPMRAVNTFAPVVMEVSSSFAKATQKSSSSVKDNDQSSDAFRFKDYRVTKKVGEGGMGTVYTALKSDDSIVAIKFLRSPDSNQLDQARFVREIEIANQLKHPAIVESLDCGEFNRRLFIVMKYCSGGNLAEMLTKSGTLQPRRALRLIDRLLGGLDHAHQLGIVHRDLKPSNILLDKDDRGKYHPVISDFGLAKHYQLAGDSGMTMQGTVGGSLPYMPREQLTNFRFVTPQCDVWSMGAILYECLTGKLPRVSTNKDAIWNVLNAEILPIDRIPSVQIPVKIQRFVMKALALDPAERFKDGGQMRAALHVAAKSEGIEL
jgi:hypothetical protein